MQPGSRASGDKDNLNASAQDNMQLASRRICCTSHGAKQILIVVLACRVVPCHAIHAAAAAVAM